MNHILLIISLFLFFPFYSFSIELSDQTEVSLLTCGEGDELHSFFGHSAIRFKDPVNAVDMCFNWGLFEGDPSDPQFKVDFAKGLIKYKVSEEPFEYFMMQYYYEERSVFEQVLNLSSDQINILWKDINENLKPENRYYKYDFFFDNCATKVRDLILNTGGDKLQLGKHDDASQLSFRQIISHNFSASPWINFGTDIILGKIIDEKATNNNLMFLPRYIEQIFDKSTIEINGKTEPFVIKSQVIYEGLDRFNIETSWLTPTLLMWFVFFITFILTVFRIPFLTKFWDSLILLTFSILGLLICFLWFATEHGSMRSNYNILWANPLLIIFIITMLFTKLHHRFTKIYLGMAILYFFVIIGSMLIPQEFNTAFTPLILLLTMKFFYWHKQTKELDSQSTN